MADAPRGYGREVREVFTRIGSELSDSQKHDGLKSGLARDRKSKDLSHSLIGDRVEPRSEPEPTAEDASANAPDIARLVPLALVAVAGIAAGVASVKVAQGAKKRRQAARAETPRIAPATATPAGWYEVANDPTRLRYWNGFAWTNDYAQRARAASIVADWYPDPSSAAQLRYWDGSAWTHHVSPRPGAVRTPADWYRDPTNAAQLRYWDGTAWTNHITSDASAAPGLRQAGAPSVGNGLTPANEETRITMSSAEWQAHVRAWLQAGAIQQELWRRLSNAHIQDADDATLAAQRKMEALTHEEGVRQIQRMLEVNPALREQHALMDFRQLFGDGRGAPLGVETNHERGR